MEIENLIRKIVVEELDKARQDVQLESLSDFCRRTGVSRTTVWRDIKKGHTKCVRIGRRILINPNQFVG